MKTSADLRKYLINLSATDLSMAVFTEPFNYTNVMYGFWKFLLLMCLFSRFMSICTINVSIFTFTAIGIERKLKFILHFKEIFFEINFLITY
jgi:tachykinin-like receptor